MKVGQGGQRGTQGVSRPKASEVSRKFVGSGVLPGKIFGATLFRLASNAVENISTNTNDVLS